MLVSIGQGSTAIKRMRELKSPLSLYFYVLTVDEGFVAQFLFLSLASVSEAFAFVPYQRYGCSTGSIFVLRAFPGLLSFESGIPSCSIYGQIKAVRPRVVPRFTHTLALSR